MIEAQRSKVQKAVRAAVAQWAGDILADGVITDEAREGFRVVIECMADDDDDFDGIVAEMEHNGLSMT